MTDNAKRRGGDGVNRRSLTEKRYTNILDAMAITHRMVEILDSRVKILESLVPRMEWLDDQITTYLSKQDPAIRRGATGAASNPKDLKGGN
jgi:hypothetical protein